MYTDDDLDEAVKAGVFSRQSVDKFKEHLDLVKNSSTVDEENFRLLTGFNDIFVVIAALLLLISGTWVASSTGKLAAAVVLASLSWGLAEFFVLKRRMALPAIILLITFLVGILSIPYAFSNSFNGATYVSSAVLAVIAAWLHWLRFRVPITIAAGTASAVTCIIAFLFALFPGLEKWLLPILFISGVLSFLLAMYWDASDTKRITRNTDVAFWLHLFSAPLIVHPVFSILGVLDGKESLVSIVAIIVLYLIMTIVSIAVDRRAIMVSALVYVLYALTNLLKTYGVVSYSFAISGICFGLSLLLLSAFWHQSRVKVLKIVPDSIKVYLPGI